MLFTAEPPLFISSTTPEPGRVPDINPGRGSRAQNRTRTPGSLLRCPGSPTEVEAINPEDSRVWKVDGEEDSPTGSLGTASRRLGSPAAAGAAHETGVRLGGGGNCEPSDSVTKGDVHRVTSTNIPCGSNQVGTGTYIFI